jgi:hypothetical protein
MFVMATVLHVVWEVFKHNSTAVVLASLDTLFMYRRQENVTALRKNAKEAAATQV